MTETMTIDIQGIPRDRTLRTRVMSHVTEALARVKARPVTALVAFTDQNGPKGGPDVRCAMTIRLPYKPAIRVEHVAETPRLAFDGSFDALRRRLERYQERVRDDRRHPKKYFAAKRLLAPEKGARPEEATE